MPLRFPRQEGAGWPSDSPVLEAGFSEELRVQRQSAGARRAPVYHVLAGAGVGGREEGEGAPGVTYSEAEGPM